MNRFFLVLLLSALPGVSLAETIITLGGDNIGTDNSTVSGNGAVGAHGGDNYSPTANRGLPAIPFLSDGSTRLHDFRIIAAVVPFFDQGLVNVDWQQQNWTFAVFRESEFLNEGIPFLEHSFGATPDNWNGFNRVSPVLNIPGTTPFGNFGTTGNVSEDLYELQFSFDGLVDNIGNPKVGFQNPLAVGSYFLTVQSHADGESFGDGGLAITNSTAHPEYWYDDNQILPQSVFPNLTTNPNAGIAFSVRVTAVPEPSGVALLAGVASLIVYRREKGVLMLRCLSLLVLLCLPISSFAETIITLGGDNIGSDNSTVNGNGAVAAHGGEWGNENGNFGLPALAFSSDGTVKLHDFRIIAAISESPVPGLTNVDWSQQDWTVGVFQRDVYLNEGTPFLEHSFGAEPDNWSGFTRFSSILNLPDTIPIGNFGTTGEMSQSLFRPSI